MGGSISERCLEVPAWMFDRAVCAKVRFDVAPHVDVGALVDLVKLLRAARPFRLHTFRAQHRALTTRIGEASMTGALSLNRPTGVCRRN